MSISSGHKHQIFKLVILRHFSLRGKILTLLLEGWPSWGLPILQTEDQLVLRGNLAMYELRTIWQNIQREVRPGSELVQAKNEKLSLTLGARA